MSKSSNVDLASLTKELSGLADTNREDMEVPTVEERKSARSAAKPLPPSQRKKKVLAKPEYGQGDKSWRDFIKYSQEYNDQDNKMRGTQVWLDTGLKDSLDMLKACGIRIPAKHMLSGIVRSFLDNHKTEVDRVMRRG